MARICVWLATNRAARGHALGARRENSEVSVADPRARQAPPKSRQGSTGFAHAALLLLLLPLILASVAQPAWAEIELPPADPRDAVSIAGPQAARWQQGRFDVLLLPQGVTFRQGNMSGTAQQGVVWIDRQETGDDPTRVLVYLEGSVHVAYHDQAQGPKPRTEIVDRVWFGRLQTLDDVQMRVDTFTAEPPNKPPLWSRAMATLEAGGGWPVSPNSAVQPAQFTIPERPGGRIGPTGPMVPMGPMGPIGPMLPPAAPGSNPLGPPPGFVNPTAPSLAAPAPAPAAPASSPPSAGIAKIESRSGGRFDFRTFKGPDGQPAGLIFDAGIRLVFDAIKNVQFQGYTVERIDVEADRVVVWGEVPANLSGAVGDAGAAAPNAASRPVEIYMEGNIVFREGDRVIYAERMYYNVSERFGVVLSAELLTPVPEYEGLLRLKADALQMYGEQRYQAFGAAITSSRLGVPRYWFQAETVEFQDQQRQRLNPYTRLPELDPRTGEPMVDHNYMASSSNNYVFLAGYPVFYWPTVASDLQEPSYYLQRAQLKNDSVFGTQVLLDWDLYQLLGIRNRPARTKWQLSTDVLTERGFGLGTNFRYEGDTLLGASGPYSGNFDAWGIKDSGLDNLGLDRRSLVPEQDFRGRVLWQHRQQLPWDLRLTAELGFVSDRNFLEQFYEREWDQGKDFTTGLELKRLEDNMSLALTADARINPFFTQTEWLPRLDHFWIGQSLISDSLTWSEHSHVGYGRVRIAEAPENPVDLAKFDPLPWESSRSGVRAATRQELDLPLEVGAVKLVPYLLGEVAHWGEDITGNDLTRLYGQAGLRASLPFWRADASVQSELFNLNGVAHKITLEGDIFYADASKNLDQLPLYDALDDDATEQFRRRLLFNTFNQTAGTDVPQRFDERYYALRSGLQGSVTSPSTEVVDDLMMARLGIRQRWQTKRGLPGQQRIVDWIVFDFQTALYPDPDRDNFGEVLGLAQYDFRWHVGDRLTFYSDGFADVFSEGLRTVSVGGQIGRPEQGSLSIGFRHIDGPGPTDALTPLNGNVLNANLNYRMSEKWLLSAGAAYDFGPAGNIGQSLRLTRVGESFLVQVGFNYDVSRDNFSAMLLVEPRFMPGNRLGNVGGVAIPPAGAYGLE